MTVIQPATKRTTVSQIESKAQTQSTAMEAEPEPEIHTWERHPARRKAVDSKRMTGADVSVPEGYGRIEQGSEKDDAGRVPIKDYSGLPRNVRLDMLIGALADQLVVTVECVKQVKIAANASSQTKGALEHLIHLAHQCWEPLDEIRNNIAFYVAPDPEPQTAPTHELSTVT
jgi:hypothetical protein